MYETSGIRSIRQRWLVHVVLIAYAAGLIVWLLQQ
jgi:hypothetical protein